MRPTRPVALIVDDSLTVRMDLTEHFEAAGFATVGAATLAEARRALLDPAVGLVVLDVVLPDGDGVAFLGELRAEGRTARLPVLLLSSEAEVKDRVRGLAGGADEYVGKPYDPAQVVARAHELVGRPGEGRDGPVVLVVDDSATVRATLRGVLEGAGFAVVTAESGEEGLRLAARERPQVVVVDSQMPGMDGATVIRRLRLDAALRTTPCLMLTGSGDAALELRALEAGADAFARKDEEPEVLLARLGTLLRGTGGEAEPVQTASLMAPKRILAVDDSPTYLHAVGEALRGEGYDVALARSGAEALELLSVQPVDCVLLDVVMPGMDGYETCMRIKRTPGLRSVAVVLLTALEDKAALMAGLSAGADDFVSKSADFEVLRARLRAQLRRRQFEEESHRVRTELHRAELEAAQARAARAVAEARAALIEELERKNEELEAFSYSVSHDLRAPLRSILGFGRALEEDAGELLDAVARDYLRRVLAAAERMDELIDDLLELSRVGRAELQRGAVDLTELTRQVLASLREREPERAVEARVEEGLVASGDARLLRVVLENVLDNAWKFTRRVERAVIEVGRGASGGHGAPVFFVRDNGVGFDPRQAARLFTPFQRLHSAEAFPGTGIGLATVKRVVERHGGRVWAESQPGRGTTVSWTLPEPARAGGEWG